MNAETRSNRCRPTPEQADKLLDFLEQHPWLIGTGRRYKTLHQKEQDRKAWEEIAVQLNKMEGCTKNYQQWAKYWTDKRIVVKRKLAILNGFKEQNSIRRDIIMSHKLSDVEKRIMTILNITDCRSAEGNAELLEEHDQSHLTVEKEDPPVEEEHDQSYLTVMKEDPPVEVAPGPRGPGDVSPRPASPAASETQELPAIPHQSTAPPSRYRRRISSSRRLSFANLTERFLKQKEERLEAHRRNSHLLEKLLKHAAERDKVITQALRTTTEGLRVLTEAIRNKSFT